MRKAVPPLAFAFVLLLISLTFLSLWDGVRVSFLCVLSKAFLLLFLSRVSAVGLFHTAWYPSTFMCASGCGGPISEEVHPVSCIAMMFSWCLSASVLISL